MKIDVIVPTNNIEQINGFINSFSQLGFFRSFCQLVIIGNGEVHQKDIEYKNSVSIKFIRIDEDYHDKLIPFSRLRGEGMKDSKSDFFLFMDDDNRFPGGCDCYFINCVQYLINTPVCSILQADRKRNKKTGAHYKSDGFYWTGYGLFIKNIIQDYSALLSFNGCCEETLFAYETLNLDGLAYIYYGNPTYRAIEKDPKWNENNNPSYSEKVIMNNIQGYIQEKYCDKEWSYYNDIPNTKLPNLLQEKINKRIKYEI